MKKNLLYNMLKLKSNKMILVRKNQQKSSKWGVMILVLVEVVKNIKNVVVNNEEVLSYFHTDHFDS